MLLYELCFTYVFNSMNYLHVFSFRALLKTGDEHRFKILCKVCSLVVCYAHICTFFWQKIDKRKFQVFKSLKLYSIATKIQKIIFHAQKSLEQHINLNYISHFPVMH
jgi:uncharacterized protein YaeQ